MFVCSDIVEDINNKTLTIHGRRFQNRTNAFEDLYVSTDYNIQTCSNLESQVCTYLASEVRAKMYPLPLFPENNFSIDDKDGQWFMTPLFHCMCGGSRKTMLPFLVLSIFL